MAKFSSDSGGHYYKFNPMTGDYSADHVGGLRNARKKNLFPSPTTIEKDIRVNPILAVWAKNQILTACCNYPPHPGESEESYTQRIIAVTTSPVSNAAGFGTNLHKAIEDWPQSQFLEPEIEAFYNEFNAWAHSRALRIIESESIMGLPNIGIAGTVDAIGTLIDVPGELCVLDWKTQKFRNGKATFYKSWSRQLAFYAKCVQLERHMAKMPRCVSVAIDSQVPQAPQIKIWEEDEIERAFKQFMCQAYLWFDDKKFWPMGEWAPGFDKYNIDPVSNDPMQGHSLGLIIQGGPSVGIPQALPDPNWIQAPPSPPWQQPIISTPGLPTPPTGADITWQYLQDNGINQLNQCNP